uniref:DUF4939 domain-containing protein n=1 Tax=Sinocyclocheilus rhinocerous TaxID=307959 RepID=A0A673MAT5_9TELE
PFEHPLCLPPTVPWPGPLSSPVRRRIVVAIFSGEAEDCGGFLLQCSLYFEMQSQAFTNDRAKVAFMISHLAGRALHWAQSMWESNSQAIRTLSTFTSHFKEVFSHAAAE